MNQIRCASFPWALLGVVVLSLAAAGAVGGSSPSSPETPTDTLDNSGPEDTSRSDASADLPDTRVPGDVPSDTSETTPQDIPVDVSDLVDEVPDLLEIGPDAPDVCAPQCEGKECGPDGCGDVCGNCPFAAPVCSPQGLCQLDCPQSECAFGEADCVDGAQRVCDQPCAAQEGCQECWNWRVEKLCTGGSVCKDGLCSYEQDCAWAQQQNSQLGCSFLAVDLPAYADPYSQVMPSTAPWGVQLLNPFPYPATVSFVETAPASTWSTPPVEVCGGCQAQVELPTRSYNPTSVSSVTVLIQSSSPIAVVMVNPFDPAAASNSTALLWPSHVAGTDFWVTTQPTVPLEQLPMNMASQHGYLGVLSVGPTPNTLQLTLQAKTTLFALSGDMYLPYQEEYSLAIDPYQWFVASASGATGALPYDLSGSHIVSDKPVQVYGGHEEGAICGDPNAAESCCADAMAEQLLPVARWGTEYVVVKAPVRSPTDKDVLRIQAGAEGATLSTTPVVAGIHGQILSPGQLFSAAYSSSFVLTASKPVQAVQYLAGKICVGVELGDPAMATLMPGAGGATLLAAAPLADYLQQNVVLVRKGASKVWENGTEIAPQAWTEVGSTGYFTTTRTVDQFKSFECEGGCTGYAYGYSLHGGYAHPLGASFPQ